VLGFGYSMGVLVAAGPPFFERLFSDVESFLEVLSDFFSDGTWPFRA